MPHKSKHKQQFKKQISSPVPLQDKSVQSMTAATGTLGGITAPPMKAAAVKPKSGASAQSLAAIGPARYPFLTSEMKWIGIFAGVVIIILIILKVILPLFIS